MLQSDPVSQWRSMASTWQWAIYSLMGFFFLVHPSVRTWLESRMYLQMLVQIPLFGLLGVGLAWSYRQCWASKSAPFNQYGLTGWLWLLLVSAFWMLPRALDEALVLPEMFVLKTGTLILTGVMATLSWQVSPAVVRAFVRGNLVWMLGVVGLLYAEAESRLCNGYLQDDQVIAGYGLVAFAFILTLGGLASVIKSSN